MTRDEIRQAITMLDSWRRQAALSIGSWRCYYWRMEYQEDGRYPAPWYVDPAESMAETYLHASNTLLAVLVS